MAKKRLEQMSRRERDKRIAELVKNPGTRASIPTKYLPENYRRQREMNTRLRQPIVEGSTITGRDLARQAKAAVSEKYGAADAEAAKEVTARQQREQQVGGWYDAYQQQLQTHRANTQAAGERASGQIQNLGNIQGPAGAAPVDAANQTVEQQAKAVRDALLGAMQGQFAEQGRAATTYADTLANVVGPGQKVGAMTQAAANTQTARDAIATLAKEKGAYRTLFETEAKGEESKNVLSRQALGLDELKVTEGIKENRRDRKAKVKADDDKLITSGAFAGLTNSQVRGMSADDKAILKDASVKPGKVITSGAFAGMTQEQISGKSKAWIQRRLDKYNEGKPEKPPKPPTADEKFKQKYGVAPASTDAVRGALNRIPATRSIIDQIRESNPDLKRGDLARLLLNGQKGGKDDLEIPKTDPLWASVALDLAFLNGRISAGTADKLHRAGFSVKQLGLKTKPRPAVKVPKPPAPGNYRNAPSRTGAGDVGRA